MFGSGLDVSKKKESAATTNCCQVNAVYGLPRFEIESVHALCFRSGTHILPTTMMFFFDAMMVMVMVMKIMVMTMTNKTLPQILPRSWHCLKLRLKPVYQKEISENTISFVCFMLLAAGSMRVLCPK